MPSVTPNTTKPRLLVLGVHTASEGYPNVKYRMDWLRRSPQFDVTEINAPLYDSSHHKRHSIPRLAAAAAIAHLRLFFRYRQAPLTDLLYIPYPGIFVLTGATFGIRRTPRPPIIIDAFISVYDTIVNDRHLVSRRHPMARLLFHLEKRAYRQSDLVIVDTPENAIFFQQLFGLPSSRLVAIPLATNETDFAFSPYTPNPGKTRVLFIGTLVPLHGVGVIIDAAQRLAGREDIEFRIVGTGQEALEVSRRLRMRPANVTWVTEWKDSKELAREARTADICLGIFGDTAKAQRVCPLKVYAYAAVGRPIITADTAWVRNATRDSEPSPFKTVPAAAPDALSSAIVQLADDPQLRMELARASRTFYLQRLSNEAANNEFAENLSALMA